MNKDNEAIRKQSVITLDGLKQGEQKTGTNISILRAAAAECCDGRNQLVRFPAGTYPIRDDKAVEDFDALMAGRLSPYTLWRDNYVPYNKAMHISNAEELVIDGQGAELIFDGLIQPFGFFGCRHVTLKNLVIDWRRPLFSEGLVRFVKDDVVEVQVFPEYPVKGGEPVVSFQNYDPAHGRLGGVCPFSGISPLELVEPGVVRLRHDEGRFIKPGDILIMRHTYNYRPGFDLLNCSHIRFENVVIHALPGMGIFGKRCRDITMEGFRVVPSGKRIMSGNVDATHFISCQGTIRFDGCSFEGMGDDATNVHGYYYTPGEVMDERTLRVYIAHSYSPDEKVLDYPDAGETMEFVRRDTLLPYAEAVLESAQFSPETGDTLLKLDRPLPEQFSPDDLIADISRCASLEFVNSTVRNIRGRGILVQTRSALIENSSFEYCTGQGIHVDTAEPWMESAGTRDMTIRNNRFIHCGYGTTKYCDAIGVAVETECSQPCVGVHKRLTIENNLIVGEKKPAVYAACLEGAVISNNRVIGPNTAVRLEYVRNIVMEGNDFGASRVSMGKACQADTVTVDGKPGGGRA